MSADQVLVWMDRDWNQWAISLRKYYAQRIETEGFSFGEVVTDENLSGCTTNVQIIYESLRNSTAQPKYRLHKAKLLKLKSETLIVELSPNYGFIATFGTDNCLVGATMPCNMTESLQWIFQIPIDTATLIAETPFTRVNVDDGVDEYGVDEYIMAKVYEQTFSYNSVGGIGRNFCTNIFTGWSFWWRNQQFQFKYEDGAPPRNYAKSYRPFPAVNGCTCFTNGDGSSYTSEWYQGNQGEITTPKVGRGNTLPLVAHRVKTQDPEKWLWRVKFSILYAPRDLPCSGTIHNILTFDLNKHEMYSFTTDDGFE